jgi:ABC-type branched-subunit amino acid transport system substrate-binding protein
VALNPTSSRSSTGARRWLRVLLLEHASKLVDLALQRGRALGCAPPTVALEASTASPGSTKVGVITDQTGPLSFMGIANANVARVVIGDINEHGGLLGRQLALCLESSRPARKVARSDVAIVSVSLRTLRPTSGSSGQVRVFGTSV